MSKLTINKILCGDCIQVLKGFPNNSIDCVVTDPPYGIGFMGKEWDKVLPPKEAFSQVFRVLKSGALAFVMSSPRQDVLWRMLAMLEGCGFQLRQSFVSWIYKSGFPKAYDVSKGIDKKRRGNMEKTRMILRKHLSKYSRKELARKLDVTIRQIDHWIKEDENQPQIPSFEKWQEIKELSDFSKEEETQFLNYQNFEYNYEVVGVKGFDSGNRNISILQGNTEILETKPFSNLAKKWQGWKSITGLKPALECVLMVNKPLSEKTIVDNVLKHGVGAINVDACRIPCDWESDPTKRGWQGRHSKTVGATENFGVTGDKALLSQPNIQGRFPANLLVSDKALDTGKITRTTYIKKEYQQKRSGDFLLQLGHSGNQGYNDVGDQSRFFDLDAWAEHHVFLDVPKASKQERDKGLENVEAKNTHPTVKPIRLMAYLIELGCPKDGIVLDPFVGSGTTCIASHQLGRKWIGIEINEDYANIARHRIATLSQHLTKFMESNRN